MGGQPQTIQQTKTEDKSPWAGAQPYYMDLYGKSQNALNATNNNPFQGNFIAQSGADATQGLDMLRAGAGATAPGAQAYMDMATKTAQGGYLDPNTNPWINNVASAALRPLQQGLNQNLGNISDRSIASGAYGGARQDLQQNRALDDFSRAAGDITSNIFYNNYNAERQNQVNSGQMLGTASNLMNIPGQQLLAVDAQQRQNQQLGLDNALQKYQMQQSAPWYGLGEMAQILGSGGFSSTTSTGTMTNPNYQDPFTSILKSVIGVGSAVGGMGGSGGFKFW